VVQGAGPLTAAGGAPECFGGRADWTRDEDEGPDFLIREPKSDAKARLLGIRLRELGVNQTPN